MHRRGATLDCFDVAPGRQQQRHIGDVFDGKSVAQNLLRRPAACFPWRRRRHRPRPPARIAARASGVMLVRQHQRPAALYGGLRRQQASAKASSMPAPRCRARSALCLVVRGWQVSRPGRAAEQAQRRRRALVWSWRRTGRSPPECPHAEPCRPSADPLTPWQDAAAGQKAAEKRLEQSCFVPAHRPLQPPLRVPTLGQYP